MTQSDAVQAGRSPDGAEPASRAVARHGRAFLSWWVAELKGLLPDTLRERFAGEDRRAGLFLDGDTLHLTDLRGGQTRAIGRIDLAGMSAAEGADAIRRTLSRAGLTGCSPVLGLPEPLVLRKRESLPAGTERRAEGILRLKLENTAPMPAGSYHWGYRLLGQDDAGRLEVECVLVKREPLEALAARLAELNVELAGVVPERDMPGPPSLNLLPGHLRQEPYSLWSPLNRGLAALAGVLAVLAVAMTFYRQADTLESLNGELADLRGRAKSVLAMRAEAQGRLEAVSAVRDAKSEAPPLMGILDEVSRLLPDGTWVTGFRLRGNEVQLIGQSQSAASLIGLIERSARFDNASFGSPVVRDPKSGNERFNIRFEWVSGKSATAQAAAPEGGGG